MLGSIWLAIKAFGIWRRIAGALGAAWAWAVRNPAWAIALLCALGALWEHHEAVRATDAAGSAKRALVAAQEASAGELKRATAARDAAIKQAKDADNATDERVAAAQAGDARRLADYVRGLRQRSGASDGGAVPATPGANVAESGDRSSGAAVVDDTLTSDLNICTVNTRRLLEIHRETVGK